MFNIPAEVEKYRAASIIDNPEENPTNSMHNKYNVDYMNERADILDRAKEGGKLEEFVEVLRKAYADEVERSRADAAKQAASLRHNLAPRQFPVRRLPVDHRHNPEWMMGFDKEARSPLDFTFKDPSDCMACVEKFQEMQKVSKNPLIGRRIPPDIFFTISWLLAKEGSTIDSLLGRTPTPTSDGDQRILDRIKSLRPTSENVNSPSKPMP